jgi:hypothetical protein
MTVIGGDSSMRGKSFLPVVPFARFMAGTGGGY